MHILITLHDKFHMWKLKIIALNPHMHLRENKVDGNFIYHHQPCFHKQLFKQLDLQEHIKSSNDHGPALMAAELHNVSQQLFCDIFNLVQAKSSLERPLQSKRSNGKVAENQY